MGQATVYCEKCGVRLTDDDFENGRAVRYRNMTFCEECRAGLSGIVESVADEEDKSPNEVGESTLRQAIQIESDRTRSSGQSSEKERAVDVGPGRRSGGEGEASRGAASGEEDPASPSRGSRSYTTRGPTRGTHGNQMIYIGGGLILLALIVVFIVVMMFG